MESGRVTESLDCEYTLDKCRKANVCELTEGVWQRQLHGTVLLHHGLHDEAGVLGPPRPGGGCLHVLLLRVWSPCPLQHLGGNKGKGEFLEGLVSQHMADIRTWVSQHMGDTHTWVSQHTGDTHTCVDQHKDDMSRVPVSWPRRGAGPHWSGSWPCSRAPAPARAQGHLVSRHRGSYSPVAPWRHWSHPCGQSSGHWTELTWRGKHSQLSVLQGAAVL